MKFQPTFAVTLMACMTLVISTGCHRQPATGSQNPAEKGSNTSLERVRVGRPARKTLTLQTTQPGRVEAFEETPLFSKVTGYVKKTYVDIGDTVIRNQKLIQLSTPETLDEKTQKEALVAQADAEVKQAEAAGEAAVAKINTAQSRVMLAQAGIGRSEGQYNRWKSEYERLRDLAEKGSVTQKVAEEALNQFRAAESSRAETISNVESAKLEWKEAQANAARSRADLAAAIARKNVAAANLKQTITMLKYAVIRAPFNGVITRRGVDSGHYVHPANGPSARPLMVVTRTDRVRIFVDIPEMEAPLVNKGDVATIRIQSLRNQEFAASVTRTSWSIDDSNRSLRVQIDIPNTDGGLRPGMYATVTILLEKRSNVLALPISAIVREGQATFCCCVDSGKIHRKALILGLRSGNEVEVLSGLGGDELVVLSQAESFKEGQQVEALESSK